MECYVAILNAFKEYPLAWEIAHNTTLNEKKKIIWQRWQIVIHKDKYKIMISKKNDYFLQYLSKYLLGGLLSFSY